MLCIRSMRAQFRQKNQTGDEANKYRENKRDRPTMDVEIRN